MTLKDEPAQYITMITIDGHTKSFSASQADKRREFSKRQNLRRQVFREMTTYQIFPLQAMAIHDFDKILRDSCNGGVDTTGNNTDSDDGSDSCVREMTRQSAESVECDDASSASLPDGEHHLRQQFKREFLIEKSINISATAVTEEKREDNLDAPMVGKQTRIGHVDEDPIPVNSTSVASNDNDSQQSNMPPEEQINPLHVTKTESAISSKSDHHQSHTNEPMPQLLSTLWSMEPRLFAMETSMKGKRRYISSHLGRFMDHYWRECDGYSRHYYELIKESTPCRLYFDLEFHKSSNPILTPAVIEDFLTQLFDELRHQFQLTYNIVIERSGMVDLDASTPTKFSRHWILHLPNGDLFSDAREVGIFVKSFVSRLEEEGASGQLQSRGRQLLANHLFVHAEITCTDDEVDNNRKKLTRIIDLGVYTRNRIFRLMGSTKFGKPTTSALRIAEANEFPFPNGFNNSKFYLPEMGKPLLHCDTNETVDNDDFEKFCSSLSWEDHADALAATLVVPANYSKMNVRILKVPSVIMKDGDANRLKSTVLPLSGCSATLPYPRATSLYGASPFPVLERFILNTLGKRGGVVGRISTWSIGTQQPLPRTVCFNMKDNRLCDNIGRAHKSNNIIWNVHLGDRICWQSCHDPDCRGYRGKPFDLPEEVNVEIDEYFLEYELSLLIENDLIECKQDEHATTEGTEALLDSTLESAMRQLEICQANHESGSNEQTFDDESLDNELAELNLLDLVANDRLINPSTRTEKFADDYVKKCNADLSVPRNNDDHLNLDLATLNISDFESIRGGSTT